MSQPAHPSLFSPRSRKLVLVAHGMKAELRVLSRLGINTVTSVIGIMDTTTLPKRVLRYRKMPSLAYLLDLLQVSHHSLHSAGNDVHFTLRCLLL